jgi:hypothetical protein
MGFTHFKHIKNENKDVEQYAEADLLAVMLFAL